MMYHGTKIYRCLDVYHPNGDEVEAITFSSSEEYIEKVSEV